MSDSLDLWCLVDGDSLPFIVSVSLKNYIAELQKLIREECKHSALATVDAKDLVLWKLRNPVLVGSEDEFGSRIKALGADCQSFAEKLNPMETVRQIFSHPPPVDRLHIFVKFPVTTTISPSPSKESNASSVPSTSDHWSPRSDTVRGTPGCGKTTLMNLLHAYILKQTRSPCVYTKHSWPQPKDAPHLDRALWLRLREVDPKFPRPDGLTFLLFDEGQDSYQDHFFWNSFLKGVGDGLYDNYRVILFCSYGSPSSRPVTYNIGVPPVLRDAARISLWPGERSIGILLKRSEFDEVVSRFERPLNLHPDLLDLIFDWTAGHAGAVVELLRVISYQRELDTRRGVQLTVEAFYHDNSIHDLVQKLRGGAFERGLPRDDELSAQPVAALFKTLLRDGAVEGEGEVINKCHRHGWVHAFRTADNTPVYYALPSPLHNVCFSWRLEPTNDMPRFISLFDLAIDAISKFKPSQLRRPFHRVGARTTDRLPEAQYEDEFYRSVFSLTAGNVRFSPEFAAARRARVAGRIDFFIPVVKWGIEITRDGSRLAEHSSRFAESGAYGAWLKWNDMADYILLDCRTSIPEKQHPEIPNLLHVVFRDDYQQVAVYNNMVELVNGPIVLRENH